MRSQTSSYYTLLLSLAIATTTDVFRIMELFDIGEIKIGGL